MPRASGRRFDVEAGTRIDDERVARPLVEWLGLVREATGPPLAGGDATETTDELDEPQVSYDE